MKLTIVFLLTFFLQQGFSANAQHLNISKKDATLLSILKEIRAQSGYDFFFEETSLENAQQVSIHIKDGTLEEVLAVSFKNQPFTYSITKNAIVIKNKPLAVIKQEAAILQNDIKGTVVDENGETLPGATVQVKGTQKTVMTNENGEFVIKDVDNNATLVISFIGYKSKEVLASKASGTIKLEVNSNELEEVGIMVSTGYQKIPKERAAGSFSLVTADDMKGKLQSNIMERIEGLVPGMTSYKGEVNIRGKSTVKGNQKPLIVLDGIPFEGDIDDVNPSTIESINILKDATAASIYGARAANGVIVITTISGKAGALVVSYDASVKFTPLPDRDYANKMNSSELIDFQKEMFGYRSGSYAAIDPRKSMHDIYGLLYEHREGNLSDAEFESALDVYRKRDRYDQVVDEFLNKVGVLQQHNLGFSGGSDFNKYSLSGNYLASNPNEKSQSSRKIGFNLRNSFKFTDWFSADLGILGANNKSDNDAGILGMDILNKGKASYFMLRDENGNPEEWLNGKSNYEIDRLNGLGLLDETYIPLHELNKRRLTSNSNYINFNLGTQFKLYDGLSLDLRYQHERTDSYRKDYLTKDYYKVKTQINDATVMDKINNSVKNYIPKGGQVSEDRGELNSHTLRAQLNYSNLFNSIHQVDVIAGAEQRKIVGSSTNVYRYGYDDHSLSFIPLDEFALNSQIKNTEAVFGSYYFSRVGNNFSHSEDRFVSFYGNGSYTYDRKLTASASIRMDQSNLFGTDPKYQYRPLWSTGLLYVITQNEIDWLDRLAVRTTYGINGSIPKEGGPYMITKSSTSPNKFTYQPQDYVSSPPNSGLRWEKTKVTNFGLDFKMFRNTFSGSIDIYNKSTSDLLGTMLADPTIGWSSVLVNYGDMNNKGIELTLNREHVNTMDFRWSSGLNFSYNKNEITRLENSGNTIYSYLYEGRDAVDKELEIGQNRVGKPMNAIYSIRYGGLDNTGRPIALKKDGTQVKETSKLSVEDLVYEGTGTPPFAASLQNNLSYKNFDLFFMFTYYGGHVMRAVTAPYLTKYAELNYTSNMDRLALNYWKKPGDELIPGIAPGFLSAPGNAVTNIWEGADQHIQKADYIKLRDITLSYNLANETLKKYHVQGMRFSLQVQNAWRWAANDQNLDPEVWRGTRLTATRGDLVPPTYTFGLSVNF